MATSKFSGFVISSCTINVFFYFFFQAIDLILEPMMPNMPMLPMLTPSSLVLACFVYKSSRDVLKAVSVIDENQMDSVPSKLLFSIEKHGENLAEALNAVNYKFYDYKCYLLISNFLKVPLDLRKSYVHSYLGLIWNKIVSKRIAKFGVHLIIGDLVYDTQHNQVILLDDGNKHKFTIYDVVLPLPGPDTIYPDNVIANWYDDLFKWDWLPKKNFNRNSKY
jgi:tRNA pseudouridine13 synthase